MVSAPGGARTAAAIAAAQNAGFDDIEEPIAASQRANPRVAPEDILYAVVSNLKQGSHGRWVWLYDAMGLPSRFDDLPSEDKGWEQLTLIRCPVLLVRGEESDVLSEATAARMVQTISNCRLAIMPQSGHGVPRDNPAAFLAAVRPFLLEGL